MNIKVLRTYNLVSNSIINNHWNEKSKILIFWESLITMETAHQKTRGDKVIEIENIYIFLLLVYIR